MIIEGKTKIEKENKEVIRMLKVADDMTKQTNNKSTFLDKNSKITVVCVEKENLNKYWEDKIKILWNDYFCFKEAIKKDNIKKAKNLQDLKEINVYVLEEKTDKYLLKEIKKLVLM